MDALSEALRSMRITGALFFNAELTAPWGFASPPSSSAHQILAPGTEHLVLFHLVTEGQATVRIDGHDDVTLEAATSSSFRTATHTSSRKVLFSS